MVHPPAKPKKRRAAGQHAPSAAGVMKAEAGSGNSDDPTHKRVKAAVHQSQVEKQFDRSLLPVACFDVCRLVGFGVPDEILGA